MHDTLHILLVEDNPNDALLFQELARENSYESIEIIHVDSVEAVTSSLLDEHPFSVIILDLTLGSINGADAIQYVQRRAKSLPIIVLTGDENPKTAKHAVSLGVQDYLVKGKSNGEVIRRAIGYAIQRKRYEEKIAYLTMQDHLTGLMNGDMIPSTLKQALASAKREKSLLAVYFVDIDDFKDINDAHGHDTGNALLIDIASRLQNTLDDNSILARLSGDTFVIIDIAEDLTACAVLAQEIIETTKEKAVIGSLELRCSASIGVATFPECSNDHMTLMKYAEIALHEAKKTGRGNYHFFSEELNSEVTQRIHITAALKEMVGDEGFSLYYQPKIDLKTMEIAGAEALIRWQHTEYGVIRPDMFIPLAEEAGLIHNVSAWVTQTACIQHQNEFFRNSTIAVNISAKELCNNEIVSMIQHLLESTGMEASNLILEITETAMMEDAQVALGVSHKLIELGVKLHIDDFGTGYSSIDYLRRFPLDAIKIDQSFVRHMLEKPDDLRVVKLMVDIGHDLGLRVIAEGVETYEQFRMLSGLGCDIGQGYFFSRPMPAKDYIHWAKDYSPENYMPKDVATGLSATDKSLPGQICSQNKT